MCPDDGDACTSEMCLPIGGGRELCLALDDQCVTDCSGAGRRDAVQRRLRVHRRHLPGRRLRVDAGAVRRRRPAAPGPTTASTSIGCRSGAPPLDDPICEAPTGDLDWFTCYGSKASRNGPRLEPVFGVPVADRFGSASADVRKHEGLCLPTSVNGADPTAPAHPDKLAGYVVRLRDAVPTGAPMTDLAVSNAFGTLRINLKKIDGAMVPSALSTSTTPPGPPVPPDPDRFACYKAAVTPGTTKFMPVFGVTIADQLGALTVDVIRPSRLCTPLDLGPQGDAAGHALQLLCYQVRTSSGTPRFVKRTDVLLGNELGAEQVDVVKLAELCVPSTIAAP